jgi:glutamate 5-kinase
MQTWQAGFAPHGITVAQVLLTHEDLRVRARYLGVKETLAQVIGLRGRPGHQRERRRQRRRDPVRRQRHALGDGGEPRGAEYLLILSTAPGPRRPEGHRPRRPRRREDHAGDRGHGRRDDERDRRRRHGEQDLGGQARDPRPAAASSSPAGPSPTSSPAPRGHRARDVLRPERAPPRGEEALARLFPEALGHDPVNACAVPVLRDQGRSLLAVGVTGSKGISPRARSSTSPGPTAPSSRAGKSSFASAEIAAIAGKKGDQVRALFPSRNRIEVVHRNDLALL